MVVALVQWTVDESIKWKVWVIDKALTGARVFENLAGIVTLADSPKGLLI